MDATELYQVMEDLSLLTKDTLPKLKQLTEAYPYFHTAKILYLKNLAVLNAANFASELERMAIYISDRRKLFTLIEGTRYGFKVQTAKEKRKKDDSFSLIDSFLSSHSNVPAHPDGPANPDILFRPSASSDYLLWKSSEDTEEAADTANGGSPPLKGYELIDSFLEKDRQREPGRGLRHDDADDTLHDMEEMKNKTDESPPRDEDSYFTETLARIYIRQKRYEKALQIIKNLSLKYPEKNVYFADQIRFLEKLIINT
ncbi:MAG: tetratricopeptide repeat protein, partial [Tannerellaceae bacterium]|nr:tetratricopeptide repeat protein [Tannerellaceae bacterium]